jgi:hypothetical protein
MVHDIADLDKYYSLWRDGKSQSEIKKALAYSDGRWKDAQAYFLHYCRRRNRDDFREGMTNGGYKHLVLSPERKNEFLQLMAGGLTYEKVANIMDIPLPTIMDVWFKEDPVFKTQVDNVQNLMTARVVRALYKKATGNKYITRSTARTKGKGEKGEVDTVTVTKTEKVIEPDFASIKFWLINNDPEHYSETGQKGKGGDIGSILGGIQKAIEESSSTELDEQFDKEQKDFDEGVRQGLLKSQEK